MGIIRDKLSKDEKKELEELRKEKEDQKFKKLKEEQDETEELIENEESDDYKTEKDDFYSKLISLVENWLITENPEEISLNLERVRLELSKVIVNQGNE